MGDSVSSNHKIWGTTTSRDYKQTRIAGWIGTGLFMALKRDGRYRARPLALR